MHSSFPVRTPKLQLAAEQPSTGECWIPPKKYTPCPRAKEKPKKDGRRGKIAFRIKPHTFQRCSECSNKTLHTPGDPTETEPDLPLSVWVSPMEVWVSNGLGAADLLLSTVVQQWVVILEFSQKKMSVCPSTLSSCRGILEKVSFHSYLKEKQCQRMLRLSYNCTHLTQ